MVKRQIFCTHQSYQDYMFNRAPTQAEVTMSSWRASYPFLPSPYQGCPSFGVAWDTNDQLGQDTYMDDNPQTTQQLLNQFLLPFGQPASPEPCTSISLCPDMANLALPDDYEEQRKEAETYQPELPVRSTAFINLRPADLD